jgi:hypothetical protein
MPHLTYFLNRAAAKVAVRQTDTAWGTRLLSHHLQQRWQEADPRGMPMHVPPRTVRVDE